MIATLHITSFYFLGGVSKCSIIAAVLISCMTEVALSQSTTGAENTTNALTTTDSIITTTNISSFITTGAENTTDALTTTGSLITTTNISSFKPSMYEIGVGQRHFIFTLKYETL